MINPAINLYRTTEEAFYFRNSQINNFYMFGGIQLLPNNSIPYIKVTNTPDGINLEDWTVLAKSLCGTKSIDITSSFMVEDLINSDNGNPQIIWSLKNINADFDIDLVYLEVQQSLGETFYSTPFSLTAYESEKTTQFHYKFKRTDIYQSLSFRTWFRQEDEKIELTTYYETSTQNTVTQSVKVNNVSIYKSELMALMELKKLSEILRSPYLYADSIRCSLYEAIEFPKMKAQENYGFISYSLSFNNNDVYKKSELFADFDGADFNSLDFYTSVTAKQKRKHNNKFNLKYS